MSARSAPRDVVPPRRAAADPVRQRRPVRVSDRTQRGRARVPAPGHHARVHPTPRAVAQRHHRALQRHIRPAFLPPGALHRRRAPDRARGRVRALPQPSAPLQRDARPGARRDVHREQASHARRSRSTSSPPAGPSAARSSSSASSAPITSCGSSAARSRCPTAAPTSTSPSRSTSRSQPTSTTF